jgi:uncharacterized protein (DUF305 family)
MKRIPVMVIALLVGLAAVTGIAVGMVADEDMHDEMGRLVMTGSRPDLRAEMDMDRGMGMGMGTGMGWGMTTLDEPEYLAEMVAHHEEAVTAARELARSARPELREFGETIVSTQSAQIRLMEEWLDEWYPQQPAAEHYRPMMRDLSDLSGDDLDRAFLQDMVHHHMMAVMMSQQLLWRGVEHDDVADLARSIRDEQRAEIFQMQRWLDQWFDKSRHPMGMHPGV